jgi:predicted ribonuclease YlaK
VVVTNDAALRIKAAQVGLEAMEHQRRRGRHDDRRPQGWTTVDVSTALIDELFASPDGTDVDDVLPMDRDAVQGLDNNEFLVARAGSQSARPLQGAAAALDLLLDPRCGWWRSTAWPAPARPS